MRTPIAIFLLLTACSSNEPMPAEALIDQDAPWLDVQTPLRGSMLTGDAPSIEVRGYADDDRPGLIVAVNGYRAQINLDKTFVATVPVYGGITILETVATDARGNRTRDTRAVLAGELVPAETPVVDGMVAHLDAAAVKTSGEALAKTIDFVGVATRANPLMSEVVPCFGARASVQDLKPKSVKLVARPVGGGLAVEAELTELSLGVEITYSDTCKTEKTVAATARAAALKVNGVVGLSLVDGKVVVDVERLGGDLEGFVVTSEAAPAGVVGRVQAAVGDRLVEIITAELARQAPSIVLRGLADETHVTMLRLDERGASAVVDTVVSQPGGMYIPSKGPRPTLETRRGWAFGVADDALNQLLSTSWANGVLDGPLDDMTVSYRLPPFVSALANGEGLGIVLGDVAIDVVKDGRHVSLALSAELRAAAKVSGGLLTLTPSSSNIRIGVVRASREEESPYDDTALTAVGAAITSKLVEKLGTSLSRLPLPVTTAVMTSPTGSSNGYLVVLK